MIEVLLCSVDEPQLGRCLKSLDSQKIKFDHIVHMQNVVPYSKAHNTGLTELNDEWCVLLAGDMILHDYASEIMVRIINERNDPKAGAYLFGLYDKFLKCEWGGVGLYRTKVLKQLPFVERLNIDGPWGGNIVKLGYTLNNCHEHTLGTHFDSPDEYQVFRRFYVVGLHYKGTIVGKINNDVNGLFKKTGDPLYLTAMKAIEFAVVKKGLYPGSHNIDFDKKMYEEFNAIQTP